MSRRFSPFAAIALIGLAAVLGLPAAASAATPAVTTSSVYVHSSSTASVWGEVNPEDQATSYAAEWDLQSSTWCTSGGTSGSPAHTTGATPLGDTQSFFHTVAVDLTGLSQFSDYCARIIATNAAGKGDGNQVNWAQDPPEVNTSAAFSTSATTAKVEGTINPEGRETVFVVQYSTADSAWCTNGIGVGQGSTDSQQLPYTDSTSHEVSVNLSYLAAGDEYCARLVAYSDGGEGDGNIRTFTENLPSAVTFNASSTGGATATVTGEIIANGETTSYDVEYDSASSAWCASGGTSGSPANATSPNELAFTDGLPHDVSVDLTGLSAGIDQCARLVATNVNGKSEGAQVTWTQGSAPLTVTYDTYSTGATTATVEGVVYAHAEDTTYAAEYDLASSAWCTSGGTSGSPAHTTSSTLTSSDEFVSVDLSGLGEGTDYCAQLVATNANGGDEGGQVTWTQGTPFADTFEIDPTGNATATFDGDVNPAGKATNYDVQYDVASSQWCESGGTSGSPANSTASTPLGFTDGTFHEVFVGLAGLSQSTTYCADIVATNADGTVESFQEYWTQPTPPPPPVTLTVQVQGTGGTVTSSPAGINCSTNTCSASFAPGTKVTLTASGGSFQRWLGLCLGGSQTSRTCAVAVNSSMVVTAMFAFVVTPPHVLTVSRAGTGTGAVTSSPTAIRCGSVCSGPFPAGSRVTLTAFADVGSTFAGWSGGGCSGTGTCTVTVTADQSVTATFNHILAVASCKVPKLKGKKLAAAKTAIRSAHCAVGRITKAFSAKLKKGRVISQKPAPGSKHPAGTRVKLVVSKGRKPA